MPSWWLKSSMAGVPQGVQMKDSAAGEADKMRDSPTCD